MRIVDCDYFVVGSGMAGLMSALHLAAYGKVTLVTKGRLADCNTNFAQGGICCVMDPADTFDRHARDTMIAGAWLGKTKVVHEICEHAPEGIRDLIDCGVRFAKRDDGSWDLTREGGHSARRIFHAGDITGEKCEAAMIRRVRRVAAATGRSGAGMVVREQTIVIDLVMSRRIGLSGRSIVPLLIGFGCTVPAVMSTRTLPSERDRKMTILLTPFMSCSAKLPIYAFFINAFFPKYQALIMVGLYFLGIAVGILAALLFRGTLFKGKAVPFVMELPNYRLPGLRNVGQLLWEKAKDFLQRAFTVILIATIVIWLLQSFDLHFSPVEDKQDSILAVIAGWLTPIMEPLGLGDWRICTSLISGFMAKESVVSTLEILYGQDVGSVMTAASAASLLVFSLLYTPCVASIASIRRELGVKWSLGVIVWQCAVAWVCASVIHLIFILV